MGLFSSIQQNPGMRIQPVDPATFLPGAFGGVRPERPEAGRMGGGMGVGGPDFMARLMGRHAGAGSRGLDRINPFAGTGASPAGGGGIMGQIMNAFSGGAGGGMDIAKLMSMLG